MPLLKRTYALPPDAVEQFEEAVTPGQRSAVIAELLRDWLDRRKREALRRAILEGCRDMAEVYLEVEREYHPLEEEVQHALDHESKTGGNRSRAPRSRRRV